MRKLIFAAFASILCVTTALAQNGRWQNKPGILPGSQDAFYKNGPAEIDVALEAGETSSGRALINFTQWGSSLSCQYGVNGLLMSDKGKSAPLVSMGCAPQGPQGASFMAQLSADNLRVLRGASHLYFEQAGRKIPISIDGLAVAVEKMK